MAANNVLKTTTPDFFDKAIKYILVFGLVAEAYGYGTFAYTVILAVLAIGVVYAIKSRSAAKRS